ncbi:hypothetical protein QCA50_006900 [Cerrena zonata]|uniref:Zinc/iron permease n=1 Tax=Cerrena zonata TaxID=2478898 RepID=A0AAW0GGE5_9APHY
MPDFIGLLAMSVVLAVSSFGIGSLPLFFTFSRSTLAKLATFGTGLLLGTALGIIIPEGIEAVVDATDKTLGFPKRAIASPLLFGFKFMLIFERILHARTSRTQSHETHSPLPTDDPSAEPPRSARRLSAGGNGHVEFDVELGELEAAEGMGAQEERERRHTPYEPQSDSDGKKKAYPVTLGLIVHALADGLALGSSAFSTTSASTSGLSFLIFAALVVHKAPVALALSTSLLSTSLSRSDCRKHLAAFSLSTPLGALVSFAILKFLDFGLHDTWPGIALLFSGGTFLYVATVLQPGRSASEELSHKHRLILTVLGMIVPNFVVVLFGDMH